MSTLVCSQTLNVYRNWWWLIQKRVVCTKFDIYVFIAPVVISIKLLQESASFFFNGRGVCRGEGYLRQNWVQWRNCSLKINPHSYIPSANYINPYTFFVFEIWKLYPFIYYSVLYYKGPSWSWSNLVGLTTTYYICNQCLSPLTLWVRTSFRWGAFDTTLCDKVCQWRDRSVVFSGFLHQKTDRQDIHCSWNIVESGVKHHNPTLPHYIRLKSKTHWRIAHIHIINNHMIIDDCVTTVKPVVEW